MPEFGQTVPVLKNNLKKWIWLTSIKFFSLTFSLLWMMVAVVLARWRCIFRITGRLFVSLLGRLPLSFSGVVELVFRVQLHVHLGLHPQPLGPSWVLAVAGCGGLCGPVGLLVIGHWIHWWGGKRHIWSRRVHPSTKAQHARLLYQSPKHQDPWITSRKITEMFKNAKSLLISWRLVE